MEVLSELSQILYFCISLFFLFGLFLTGYYFAWTDFQPKQVDKNEEFRSQRAYEPAKQSIRRQRELSERELGLHDIDDHAALSDVEQRMLKMTQLTREFGETSPEATAEVIRGWLSDH